MQHKDGYHQRRWLEPALVGFAGLALLWTMWLSGGDFWRMQRPFMAVTMVAAATMVALATTAAVLPRGAWRSLSILLAVLAALATFFGEDMAERGRFDALRNSLAQEVAAVGLGADCVTPCRIDSREPLRVAFQFSGEGKHWSGVCYDATDRIRGAEFAGRVRRLDAAEADMFRDANAIFSGQVHHAPSWGDHWYGCSTRP